MKSLFSVNSSSQNSINDTAVFLSKILSDEGLIALAEFRNGAMKRHHFLPNVEEASKKVQALNDSGAEVYHACATYKSDEGRKQANVARVKSFWVDIDVGKADGYQTRNEAKDALQETCKAIGLHVPYVVSSGKGLHCYWLFDAAVTGDVWKAGANRFRQALDLLGFKHDPSRTTDQSSILRPVGSTWRKNGEKPVKMLLDSKSQTFGWYLNQIDKFLGANAPSVPSLAAPPKKFFDIFPVEKLGRAAEYPASSAIQIANMCGHMARMRDFKGAVTELEWRNAIGLIKYTIEGEALCHEWSKGHPEYDEAETQDKIDRWETPPTLCETFERSAPHICKDCKHKGKINSPIRLGYVSMSEQVKLLNTNEQQTLLPRLASSEGRIEFSNEPPPPRIYVLEDLILAVKVCVLAGIGGVSKTMLVMIWAVHIALGLPWKGKFTLLGSVLLILGEEDKSEIARRFNAIAKFLKLNEEQIASVQKRIWAFPMSGLDSRLTKKQAGALEGADFTNEIIDASKQLEEESGFPVRLIILDHAGLIHGGEFNSREDVVQTMQQVNKVAKDCNAAVLVLAHSPKASMGKDKADASDVAGSTAWTDLARSVSVLRPMDETEGKNLAIDVDSRKNYVSLCVVKNNYGPTGDKFWLHRIPVDKYSVSVVSPVELIKPTAPLKGGEQLQARILAKISSVVGQYSKCGFRDAFNGVNDALKASKAEVDRALNEMLDKGVILLRAPTTEEKNQFGLHHTTKLVLDIS